MRVGGVVVTWWVGACFWWVKRPSRMIDTNTTEGVGPQPDSTSLSLREGADVNHEISA